MREEEKLVKALRRGELSALEELLDRYTPYVSSVIARILRGRQADVEELTASQLDKPQRELFVRHYYYGQTVQEAALAMGLNQSTAKTWLRRGRETLKTILEQEGYGHEAVGDFQTDGRVHG